MAKDKKNFLKGKMNKDLDDRILPPGEYRDARNLAISRSEGSKVGSLENILGNKVIPSTDTRQNRDITSIGYYVDKQFARTIVFVTDYVDSSTDATSIFAGPNTLHYIYLYDHANDSYHVLVTGSFLNFSKRSNITGVNVLENMLFWTDDRNQPRKINIDTALANECASVTTLSSYYNSEDTVSVAKYAPINPISLMNIDADQSTAGFLSTMTNPTQALLPDGVNPNPQADPNFAGDKNYLKDKFVRFSYRFQFDDGEYSLMAPFTQIAFVPKQNGYFLAENINPADPTKPDSWSTDAQQAYRSTIVDFMENNVTQIGLNILFDTTTPGSTYNIRNIDILYKEADEIAIKVVETIDISKVELNMSGNFNTKVFSYTYISTQPVKTLPQDQSTRVYDMVPVRAQSQEIISNRVVYGNYYDKKSPPSNINYQLSIAQKSAVATGSDVQIEYPNHTLKQNRTYQVGLILADRYGRESSVVLSNNDTQSTLLGVDYSADTIFSGYNLFGSPSTLEWPGNSLLTIFNEVIADISDIVGYAGVYKDESYGVDEVKYISNAGTGYADNTGVATTTVTAESTGSGLTVDIVESTTVPGTIEKVTVNTPGTGYRSGETVAITGGNGDARLIITANPPNPLGWHTWKIVVKQTEQEYYNVYLPGILAGYPNDPVTLAPFTWLPTNENDVTSNIVLTNDNINKIPRDLSEVGPDQKQYRSTVGLYARVQPIANPSSPPPATKLTYSSQFITDPDNLIDVVSVSSLLDTNFNTLANQETIIDTVGPGATSDQLVYDEFYASETNPLIARLNGGNRFGVIGADISTGAESSFGLGVVETEPFDSALDIYYETATNGLVRDLNTAIINNDGGDTPAGLTDGINFNENLWTQNESMCPGTNVTGFLDVVNLYGAVMTNIASVVINTATIDGVSAENYFNVAFNVGTGSQVQISLNAAVPWSLNTPNVIVMYLNIITTDGNFGQIIITGTNENVLPIFKESWQQNGCAVPERFAGNPTPGVATIQDLSIFQLNNAWGSLNQGGQVSTTAEDESQGIGIALGSNSYVSAESSPFPITNIPATPEYELFDEVRIDTFYPENGFCCSEPLLSRQRGVVCRINPADNPVVELTDGTFKNMFEMKNMTLVPRALTLISGGTGYTVGQWSTTASISGGGINSYLATNQFYTNNLYNLATDSDGFGTVGEGLGLRVNVIVDPATNAVIGLNPNKPIQDPGVGYRTGDRVLIKQPANPNGTAGGTGAIIEITCGGWGLYVNEDISNQGINAIYNVIDSTVDSNFGTDFQAAIDSLDLQIPFTGGQLNYQQVYTQDNYFDMWASMFDPATYPQFYDDQGNFVANENLQGVFDNYFAQDTTVVIKPQPPVSDPNINNPETDASGQWIGLRPQGGEGQLKVYTLRIDATDEGSFDGSSSTPRFTSTTGKYMRTDLNNFGSTRVARYKSYPFTPLFGYTNYFNYPNPADSYRGQLPPPGPLSEFGNYTPDIPGQPNYQYKHIQNRISTTPGEGLSINGSGTAAINQLKVTSPSGSASGYPCDPTFSFGTFVKQFKLNDPAPITSLQETFNEPIHIGGEPIEFILPDEIINAVPAPTSVSVKGILGGYNPYGASPWFGSSTALSFEGDPVTPGGSGSSGLYGGASVGITGDEPQIITRSPFSTPWPEFALIVGNAVPWQTPPTQSGVYNIQGNFPTLDLEGSIETDSYIRLTEPSGATVFYNKQRTLDFNNASGSSTLATVLSSTDGGFEIKVTNPALTDNPPIQLGMSVGWEQLSAETGSNTQVIAINSTTNTEVSLTLNSPYGLVSPSLPSTTNSSSGGFSTMFYFPVGVGAASTSPVTNISDDCARFQIQAGAYIHDIDPTSTSYDVSTSEFDLTLGALQTGTYSLVTSIEGSGITWTCKNKKPGGGFGASFDYAVQIATPGTMAMYLDIVF